jgi:hypothetical protein
MRNLFSKLLLAICLLASSGFVAAGPIYRVDIDTSTLGGGPAYLGFSFLGLGGATPATAILNDLSGALLGTPVTNGSVTGSLPGPFVFSNAGGGADLVQAITLGGVLSFDLSFELGSGLDGTTFAWSLFNDTEYLGVNGDMGSIFLDPAAALGEQINFVTAGQFSNVAVIPEPSSIMLLLLAGWGMVTVRRARMR